MNQFLFLKSTRFWALLVGAVSLYLKTKGIFGDAEMVLVTTIMAGFISIRTVDRSFDKVSNKAETPPIQ